MPKILLKKHVSETCTGVMGRLDRKFSGVKAALPWFYKMISNYDTFIIGWKHRDFKAPAFQKLLSTSFFFKCSPIKISPTGYQESKVANITSPFWKSQPGISISTNNFLKILNI